MKRKRPGIQSALRYVNASVPIMGAVIALVLAQCASTPPPRVDEYPVEITNLGAIVNSSADDFSPTVTAGGDLLYFCSDRGGKQAVGGQDFWISSFDGMFWKLPLNAGPPVNTVGNEGSPSITGDGTTLVFAACGRADGVGRCDLYLSRLEGMQWGEPRNVGPPVNTAEWESQPSISVDGNVLFFVSDRDGGLGGLDIWRTERLPDGSWAEPVNVGPSINTEGDETSPYIAADGKTLYFSSDGRPGLGKTDIFVSRFVDGAWTEARNVGRPLNSELDDEFFTLSAEGTVIYFASQREGGLGGYDLYRAEPNPFPPGAVVYLRGTVRDWKTKVPLKADIEVIDKETGATVSTYTSNEITGRYAIVLAIARDYRVVASAAGYTDEALEVQLKDVTRFEERSHDFLLRSRDASQRLFASVNADLWDSDTPVRPGEETGLVIEEIAYTETVPLLHYVFFEQGKAELPSRYKILLPGQTGEFRQHNLPSGVLEQYHHLLNILGYRLQRNPGATVTLTGCNDGVLEKGDLDLSRRRVETVRDYLVKVWNIAPERIIVHSRGIPERPSPLNTPEGMEENRRVEIVTTPDIMGPAVRKEIQRTLNPSKVVFNLFIESSEGLRRWDFHVTQDGNELRMSDGYSTYPDSIPWNWRNPKGEAPATESPLQYYVHVVDAAGNEMTTEPKKIPVHLRTLERKRALKLPDRRIEKISLILFDFNSSEVAGKNEQILAEVKKRVASGSTILVQGHTDRTGDARYNLKLSAERAASVARRLAAILGPLSIRYEGLGEEPLLFDNDTPEGRFYCRTVQVSIETPVH
ncbi:MAG: OmpA family protein [Chlorobi bacterium]|nr:OmpA family protein [Chlorobiota bacterium]